MSRIGRMPIAVPAGVTVTVADGNVVTVKGPKGTLTKELHPDMIIKTEGSEVTVSRPSEIKMHKALHGLTRTLLNNMVVGVTDGFEKKLEVNGVGYRAQLQGKKLVMNLGYSHLVEMEPVDGVTIEVPSANEIVIKGIDNQVVGQFAAKVREKRPPEPYKGKGIKYATEHIRRKEGKTGSKK
ncbi:MAG TPA: 50S ribosomal protein L6 [Clostridiales bacterium]|uniref:Large ribosomal subunit protein uL6 n=3 Tax=Congzhengia TaxID=2944150 RepID=A0A926HTY0_9FIRM|nr:50S ribosomal protein L6 [Congzhengia minquanensis]MBD8947230.1 50S ribosomal protein L6 [Clostridiales bacterium]HBL81491.1 50S ribosomal protein L6 [Clostridiales bacterium]